MQSLTGPHKELLPATIKAATYGITADHHQSCIQSEHRVLDTAPVASGACACTHLCRCTLGKEPPCDTSSGG
eukprot:1156625-Pelagomonas_calceolata.AAC.7